MPSIAFSIKKQLKNANPMVVPDIGLAYSLLYIFILVFILLALGVF